MLMKKILLLKLKKLAHEILSRLFILYSAERLCCRSKCDECNSRQFFKFSLAVPFANCAHRSAGEVEVLAKVDAIGGVAEPARANRRNAVH
jgi:hypothetical protein